MEDKRADHNKSEKKRRDQIKVRFNRLRKSLPGLTTGKVASRAQILRKTAEHIVDMTNKEDAHKQNIDKIRRQNELLKAQIRTLEEAAATGSFSGDAQDGNEPNYDEAESGPSDGNEPNYDEAESHTSDGNEPNYDEPESDTSDGNEPNYDEAESDPSDGNESNYDETGSDTSDLEVRATKA